MGFMKTGMLTCALCGHVYDPLGHSGCPACPLQNACSSVCCPQCGYQTVNEDKSVIVNLIRTLGKKSKSKIEHNGLMDEKK
jgi:hypothetical protein